MSIAIHRFRAAFASPEEGWGGVLVAGFTGMGRRGGRGWCRPDSNVWDIWAGLVGVLVTEAYDVFAGGGGWGGGVRAVGVVMS